MADDSSSPAISVIVLAWRLTDQLVDCVRAVRAQDGAESAEVVVVVNGSDESVRDAARRSGADRVIESPVNLGFGGGVNLGVSEARGRFLILLNDDAVPRSGWLAALVARAESDESIGAVASLLVDDEGLVQEAGSRVLSGGGTRQWGRGLEPAAAEAEGLLAVRDVDYGSAAALLVRRDVFDGLSGFDSRYEPAYYEDVDLQLRIRLAGRRVVLEPEAVVEHASGASTGGGAAIYREYLGWRAGRLFIDRWREVLDAVDDHAPVETLAPVVELGEAERAVPTGSDGPAFDRAVVHPAVAEGFVDWLVTRTGTLERTVAEQDAAYTALRERFDLMADELHALQAEHHELSQSAHALHLRVEELQGHPLRTVARGLRRR